MGYVIFALWLCCLAVALNSTASTDKEKKASSARLEADVKELKKRVEQLERTSL